MENEETFEMPSYLANSLEAFNRLGKLREQQKHKEHELEKAMNEITLTQKDEKYQTYLLNTIKQMEEKTVEKRKTLEERRAKLQRDIEKVDRELEKLDTADQNQSTSYFVNELARINDTKKSNPKIRALEFDLDSIKKEVQSILETVANQDNEINKRVEAENKRKNDILAARQAEIDRINRMAEEQRKNPPKSPAEIWEEKKYQNQNQVYFQPPPQNHQPLFPNIIGDTKKKRIPKTVSIE